MLIVGRLVGIFLVIVFGVSGCCVICVVWVVVLGMLLVVGVFIGFFLICFCCFFGVGFDFVFCIVFFCLVGGCWCYVVVVGLEIVIMVFVNFLCVWLCMYVVWCVCLLVLYLCGG